MNYTSYLLKFLYRIRYWLVFAPLIIASFVYIKTAHMKQSYTAYSTIYTGIITGVNILSESGVSVTSSTQNSMMDNLLNLTKSDQTLKNVSLRLYARSMVYGDPEKDNTYIKASNYKYIYNHGKSIHHLIDKSSPNDSINELNTYKNLVAYDKNDPNNYVYGIYQWNLPYFNRNALKNVQVERAGKSDMLELSYSTDDPGIAYQTLRLVNDEFINQYQALRFGETNNVIAYFEAELARISAELREAEDSLTVYSVDNQVINYGKETEQVASLNTEYELNYWNIYQDYESSNHLIQDLEKRMGTSAEIFRKNSQFLASIGKISSLSEQLALSDSYSGSQISDSQDSLKSKLQKTEDDFQSFAAGYGDLHYSKEGVSNKSVINEWLIQIIINEKAKAQLEAIKKRKEALDQKYVHYAPIGSTLNRKERSVNISEKSYFATMDALNAARLRQKSLQMTSASLKIMNDPVFPVSPQQLSRKKITIIAFLATFVFVLFFSLLIELLDHTLHSKLRTEMLTGGQAVAAFARISRLKNRQYNQIYAELSTKTLCNLSSTYFKPERNNIINIISHEPNEGKSYIIENMAAYFKGQGMNVETHSWHNDHSPDTKTFIQSLELSDLNAVDIKTRDTVILVEYPSLKEVALTQEILQGVSVNLLIVDSRRTWKNTDQRQYERTKEMAKNTPIFFVLNNTRREAAEDFNGLMPPYTYFRKLFYRLSQLGLTAKDSYEKYV